MYYRLIDNHVLANLTFVLILALGLMAYLSMPRQQDPNINFNWISIVTVYPGASAEDVEKRITDPLEDAIRGLADVKFVSSNSRPNTSNLLVRFEDIDSDTFDKRVADLRREVENARDTLPDAAEEPLIVEVTSANAFPAATVAVQGEANDEVLRKQAQGVRKDLEQLKGVERVDTVALSEPELLIRFDLQALEVLQVSPLQVADTVTAWFQDVSAGDIKVDNQNWLIRLTGKSSDVSVLAELPIIGAAQEIRLGRVASIERARAKASESVFIEGKPAVLMAVMKKANANVVDMVERIQAYLAERNQTADRTGVDLVLVDDQTIPTRNAINIMQGNALIGLGFVLLVTWIFLGLHIAFLTSIGIPFVLALTFWILSATGETLNVTVLLGVVIVLGMLVDDAVVVVESIYYRLQRGMETLDAAVSAMREIALPVTTAILTTVAAFLPLMLMPGILGKFMRVIPMVVTIALIVSLIEAFWMLPSHIGSMKVRFDKPSRVQRFRERATHWIQIRYARLLIKAIRHPVLTIGLAVSLFASSIGVIAAGMIPMNFFASDSLRLFYVNVEMPSSTSLQKTMDKVLEVEQQIRKHLKPNDVRQIAAYSGMMFTQTEPLYGDHLGQLNVSLRPMSEGARGVKDIIESMREDVTGVMGAINISFMEMSGGPPATKPISVKVRGDDFAEIQQATEILTRLLENTPGVVDVSDDASRGGMEMALRLNYDEINRAKLSPADVLRTIRLLVDGEVVSDLQDQGEKVLVRVKAQADWQAVDQMLAFRMIMPSGQTVPLRELVSQQRRPSLGNIRHYNFRRAITLEADLVARPDAPFYDCRIKPLIEEVEIDHDVCGIDAVTANEKLRVGWEAYKADFPNINLDFSGQLDDIQESLDSMGVLFLFGVGTMYLIMGTQFRSYWQPFLVLTSVPMAFTGVVYGLLLTQNPLSLYTLYGVVALAGIAVNAAIVLISAANDRCARGMRVLYATIYAARRRVIPVMITALTTIAGLFSLATGLGGHSLVWGPVATAIVWGVGFSSLLTMFMIPVLYRLFNKNRTSIHVVQKSA